MSEEAPTSITIPKEVIMLIVGSVVVIVLSIAIFYSGFGEQLYRGVAAVFLGAVNYSGVFAGFVGDAFATIGSSLPF